VTEEIEPFPLFLPSQNNHEDLKNVTLVASEKLFWRFFVLSCSLEKESLHSKKKSRQVRLDCVAVLGVIYLM